MEVIVKRNGLDIIHSLYSDPTITNVEDMVERTKNWIEAERLQELGQCDILVTLK